MSSTPPDRSDACDAARFCWCLDNPDSARHLMKLLDTGKGDVEAFCHLVDKLICSSEPKPRPAPVLDRFDQMQTSRLCDLADAIDGKQYAALCQSDLSEHDFRLNLLAILRNALQP